MSEETQETTDNTGTATKTAKKRRRTKQKPRTPSFKDWIRVIKSQGNGCANTDIRLVVNSATNVCTLITNAPASEDSQEMEGERQQIFKITAFEQVSVTAEPSEAPPA